MRRQIAWVAARTLPFGALCLLMTVAAATPEAHTPEEKAFYLQSRAVLQLNPADRQARSAVGVWHLEYGQLDAATEAFNKVAEQAPEDATATLGLILIREARGEPREALAHLDSWRQARPVPEALAGFLALVRGRLLVRAGRLAEAEAVLTEAADRNANAHDVWFWRGRLWEAQHRADRAEAAYRRAIDADPFWPEAYARLGALLQARGDPAGARDVLQGVLNLDNPSPYPNTDVGILWRWVMRPAPR